MTRAPAKRATLADLDRVEGKAELINGEVVPIMASGGLPGLVAGNVYVSLRVYAKANGGRAFGEGVAFGVPELPSGRESFAPDASYYSGPKATDEMDAVRHAPTFAVEVRSQHDYGKTPDREYADKRGDYFAAGTLAVWDVDPKNKTVTLYLKGDPTPREFRAGDIAEAGQAVPGWEMSVDAVFEV